MSHSVHLDFNSNLMMPDYYRMLKEDVRFEEGISACINCGTCTAICPAAEFYNYDPRLIAETVQTGDNQKIYELLTSDTIWYCGECMSCKTRCPRDNTPGLIIMALRHLAMKTEGCTICHVPHGSTNRFLLMRANIKMLCAECHGTIHYPNVSCINCHTQIHGSNFSSRLLQ